MVARSYAARTIADSRSPLRPAFQVRKLVDAQLGCEAIAHYAALQLQHDVRLIVGFFDWHAPPRAEHTP